MAELDPQQRNTETSPPTEVDFNGNDGYVHTARRSDLLLLDEKTGRTDNARFVQDGVEYIVIESRPDY